MDQQFVREARAFVIGGATAMAAGSICFFISAVIHLWVGFDWGEVLVRSLVLTGLCFGGTFASVYFATYLTGRKGAPRQMGTGVTP